MTSPLDVPALRSQFPILSREAYGRPLVYLDNAASAQKPRAVIDAMTCAMERSYANVHRGLHLLANETTAAFEAARKSARVYLNAASDDEIIFTAGGTDAINLVANSLGQSIVAGDEIILSVMEHHSNIVPWHFLRERKGAIIKWLDVSDDGEIDLGAYQALLTPRTRMVAVTGMSNVLGTPTPLREMATMARLNGAPFLVDGCQAAVHGAIDVQEIGCDYFVMTGHKLYGPTGIGVLYGRADALATMPPYRGGGEMIDLVALDAVTYNDPPHRFEAGTPPILEAIGLGAALDWIMATGRDAIAEHEASLISFAMEELSRLNFVRQFGRARGKGPIIAFNVDGAHPHDVAAILDRTGVAVRAGHHCAQPLMKRLGQTATARASFAVYNTPEDVEMLISGLRKAHAMLG